MKLAVGSFVVLIVLGIGLTFLTNSDEEVVTASSTTSTSTAVTTTTSSLPPPVTSFKTRSGLFTPGWTTCGTVDGVYYQETFVSPFEAEGVIAHRIDQMRCDDNNPVVYMEIPVDLSINQITDGEFDEFIVEWFSQYFAVCGTDCILAPLAEMNGQWVSWHTAIPFEYHDAYAHLRALAEPFGETIWAYAPSIWTLGWKNYAPENFDILLPSIFDSNGNISALDIIGQTIVMRDFFGKDVIIGQTGTIKTGNARDEWLVDLHRLASREGVLGVIIFDCTCAGGQPYLYGESGLLRSAIYQEILETTENE